MNYHGLSEKELHEYLKCLRNLKVGDRVEFYVVPGMGEVPYAISGRKTNLTRSMIVVANDKTESPYHLFSGYAIPLIILGSRHSGYGWSFSSIEHTDQSRIRKFCPDPHYRYFRYVGTSLFIARVHKGNHV